MNSKLYRTIALLCNFFKILDSTIYKRIYYRVKSLISPEQHGFVEKRSTITNLAASVFWSIWSKKPSERSLYQFSKNLDQIDHYTYSLKQAP